MGLIDGVKSMASNLINKVKDVIGGAVNAAKSFLRIKSPSRVLNPSVVILCSAL